jgi:hypothetical protein
MEYNTTRSPLSIREYGRHIQKMVDFLLTIDDKTKRQEQTQVVIELMGFLNPHLKNVEDFRHMLWDHLFFMSDFKLDVESPYPIPQRETYKVKPDPLPYPKRYPKYAHLGKNLELIIEKALKEDDPQKKEGFTSSIAYYMKLAYGNWHKEAVQDDAIKSELANMTQGQLEVSEHTQFKKTPSFDNRDDYRGNNNGNSRKVFSASSRNSGNRSSGNSSNRNSSNRNNGSGNNRSGNNNKQGFKKRFK